MKFRAQDCRNFGKSLQKVGQATIVVSTGVVFAPKLRGVLRKGVMDDLLPVFRDNANFGSVSNGMYPEPKIIGSGCNGKGLLDVKNHRV